VLIGDSEKAIQPLHQINWKMSGSLQKSIEPFYEFFNELKK